MPDRIVEDGADIDVAGELYYVEYLLAPREDGDLDYLLTKVDRYGVGHRVSHSCIRPPVGVRAAVEALLATWGGGKWIVRHRPWGGE